MKHIINQKHEKATRWVLQAMLFIVVALAGSCVDLDEDPTEANLAPGTYTTLKELELGVTGIYAQWSTFFVAGWAGDDITTHKASNKAEFREYDQRMVSPENSRSVNNWRDIYAMIRAANNVLANSADLQVADVTAKNILLGETYFLRGTMFFHLARIHGRIPLPLTPGPETDIKLATQVEVYTQIESDLIQAEALLPMIYPGINPGAPRPNAGTARAMLARLYLDWAGFPAKDNEKYALAASSAKTVMDNSQAHGFGLMADLEDLWKLNNRFNPEGVWTIPYCVGCGLQNRKYGKLGNPSDLLGWQETFAEVRFFEDFPDGPRKAATYRLEHDWQQFKDQQNPVFKKITGPPGDIPLEDFDTNRNDFYMRYAEVLLIYAEASGRSGSVSAEAWEALNMIRRRAEGLPFGNPDPTVDITSGDIAELAFTERKWEFAGEWIRWNDLVRMERVEQALSQRSPRVSVGPDGGLLKEANPVLGPLGTENYFAPIPQREIELNPNLGEN